MSLEKYNQQLRLCLQCKTKSAEIVRTENTIGVMCACGASFTFEKPNAPVKEVVDWWNDHYGLDENSSKRLEAMYNSLTNVTLTKIDVLSFVKWFSLLSLVAGFLIGIIYGLMTYMTVKDNLIGLLLWYSISFAVIYTFVAVVAGGLIGVVYNALSGTLGGLKLEVKTRGEELPPAPTSLPAPTSFME